MFPHEAGVASPCSRSDWSIPSVRRQNRYQLYFTRRLFLTRSNKDKNELPSSTVPAHWAEQRNLYLYHRWRAARKPTLGRLTCDGPYVACLSFTEWEVLWAPTTTCRNLHWDSCSRLLASSNKETKSKKRKEKKVKKEKEKKGGKKKKRVDAYTFSCGYSYAQIERKCKSKRGITGSRC